MKRFTKIILLTLTLALMLAVPFAVSASDSEPTLKIEAANLSFEDSVYPVFAVSGDGVNTSSVKLLVWTSPKTSESEYIKGSESAVLDSYADETIDGVPCKKFKYTKLYAKNMTDDIYVRAYAEVDGEAVYSDVVKYSVLKYAYNKLGYTGTATTDEDLKEMLEGMLVYGAGAQKYFGYKTDRLATAKFYKISVEGGYLADGTSSGLYLPGESVTITVPETDADGNPFKALVNEAGDEISTYTTTTLGVKETNDHYVAVYANADAGTEGLEYELQSDDTYAVVDYTGTATEVVIPSTYEGKAVTNIGASAFYECTSLTSISIPNSVTSIGSYAINGCTSLTGITIPDSVTSIGKAAFARCSSLTSVVIPESVASIGSSAFSGCSSLTSIEIPDSVTSISDSAFYGCTSLTSIAIPDSVTNIGCTAFYECTSLTNIVIGKKVTSIGEGAFDDCDTLKSVFFNGTIENWCNISFADNSLLRKADLYFDNELITELVIPDTITKINKYAFYNCDTITSVIIPASVTTIDYGAFWNCSPKHVYYTGTIEDWCNISFGSETLLYNANLYFDGKLVTELVIPNTITKINKYAFYGCNTITSVIIPSSVTTIDYSAFTSSSLTSIVIPESVTNISDWAFAGCNRLTDVYYTGTEAEWASITIGSYNESLADATIHYNYGKEPAGTEGLEYELQSDDTYAVVDYTGTATEVVIPSTYEGKAVTKIDSGAFYNVHHVTSISIPASVTYVNEQGFSYCQGLTAINVDSANPSYKSQGGCLFSKDGKIIYVYPQGKTDESFAIPEGVEEIHYFAFYENLYIKSLSLPSTLTTLPDPNNGRFYYCTALSEFTVAAGNTSFKAIDGNLYSYDGKSLIKYAIGKSDISISLPTGVTKIDAGAFDNASKLQSVILPEGVTEIGASAFRYCRSLSSINLPSTLTTINDSALTETALTEVTIPASVTYIGSAAFGNCKKLGSIKFEVTEGWSQQSSGSLYPLDSTVVSTPKKAAEELTYKYANAWVRAN